MFFRSASATSTLTPNMPGATFYSDACTTVAATRAMGGQTATFYFKDTLASASVTLSVANNTGLTPAGLTQAEVISAAPATQLIFISSAQTLTAGVCSAPI